MRLLLVYPDIDTIQFMHYQHGLAWISSVVKKGGHDVDLLYLHRQMPDEEFIEEIKKRDPDVIAFSSTTQQWIHTKRYARLAKEKLGKFSVIGGIHATIDPENVWEEGVFDALVRGEGEYPLLDILDALERGDDISGIKNVWTRGEDGATIRNEVREPKKRGAGADVAFRASLARPGAVRRRRSHGVQRRPGVGDGLPGLPLPVHLLL